MKERPILFSGAMVRAILEDRKTQTRRPVKPQPPLKIKEILPLELNVWLTYVKPKHGQEDVILCPYGQPGDRLWVRETWRPFPVNGPMAVLYKADDPPFTTLDWKSSIHMPRWASRITLEITNVLVERIQHITLNDVISEGICGGTIHQTETEVKGHFVESWERIYPGSWDCNDWVWVIEFKRI